MSGTKLFMSVLMLIGLPCMAMLRQQDGHFILTKCDTEHVLNTYDVHPFLRNLSESQLEKFQQVGNRIRAIQLDNGDYVVRPHGELKGGGPGLAWVAYVSINIASAAAAAATAWCPPLAASIVIGGHIAATATAIALVATPTP